MMRLKRLENKRIGKAKSPSDLAIGAADYFRSCTGSSRAEAITSCLQAPDPVFPGYSESGLCSLPRHLLCWVGHYIDVVDSCSTLMCSNTMAHAFGIEALWHHHAFICDFIRLARSSASDWMYPFLPVLKVEQCIDWRRLMVLNVRGRGKPYVWVRLRDTDVRIPLPSGASSTLVSALINAVGPLVVFRGVGQTPMLGGPEHMRQEDRWPVRLRWLQWGGRPGPLVVDGVSSLAGGHLLLEWAIPSTTAWPLPPHEFATLASSRSRVGNMRSFGPLDGRLCCPRNGNFSAWIHGVSTTNESPDAQMNRTLERTTFNVRVVSLLVLHELWITVDCSGAVFNLFDELTHILRRESPLLYDARRPIQFQLMDIDKPKQRAIVSNLTPLRDICWAQCETVYIEVQTEKEREEAAADSQVGGDCPGQTNRPGLLTLNVRREKAFGEEKGVQRKSRVARSSTDDFATCSAGFGRQVSEPARLPQSHEGANDGLSSLDDMEWDRQVTDPWDRQMTDSTLAIDEENDTWDRQQSGSALSLDEDAWNRQVLAGASVSPLLSSGPWVPQRQLSAQPIMHPRNDDDVFMLPPSTDFARQTSEPASSSHMRQQAQPAALQSSLRPDASIPWREYPMPEPPAIDGLGHLAAQPNASRRPVAGLSIPPDNEVDFWLDGAPPDDDGAAAEGSGDGLHSKERVVPHYKPLLLPRTLRTRQFEFHPTMPNLMLTGDKKGGVNTFDLEADEVHPPLVVGSCPLLGLVWMRHHPQTAVCGASHTGKIMFMKYDPYARINEPSLQRTQTAEDFPKLSSLSANCTDDFLLASGISPNIVIYDVHTGKVLTRCTGVHEHFINISRFAHTSPHIFATASFDHTCKVWDLRRPLVKDKPVKTLNTGGHNVMCVFSPDDKHVLCSGVDTRLMQFEVPSWKKCPEFPLRGPVHAERYRRCTYLSSGGHFVTAATEESHMHVIGADCRKLGVVDFRGVVKEYIDKAPLLSPPWRRHPDSSQAAARRLSSPHSSPGLTFAQSPGGNASPRSSRFWPFGRKNMQASCQNCPEQELVQGFVELDDADPHGGSSRNNHEFVQSIRTHPTIRNRVGVLLSLPQGDQSYVTLVDLDNRCLGPER